MKSTAKLLGGSTLVTLTIDYLKHQWTIKRFQRQAVSESGGGTSGIWNLSPTIICLSLFVRFFFPLSNLEPSKHNVTLKNKMLT